MSSEPDLRSMLKSAHISGCGTFRYHLVRQWDPRLAILPFLLLNPSTADAAVDDQTVKKGIGFGWRLGFGGIEFFNLYAYRATKPPELKRAGYPVGPENDLIVRQQLTRDDGPKYIVCAWGAHARGQPRVAEVMTLLNAWNIELRTLRHLKDGTPEHLLMLPYNCQPVLLRN